MHDQSTTRSRAPRPAGRVASGTLTRLAGVAVVGMATVLSAPALYFALARPHGARLLTLPLIAVLLGLGVWRRQWQLLLFVFLTPLVYWLPAMDDSVRLRIAKLMFPFVLLAWGMHLAGPRARPIPRSRLVPPLLAYMGLVILSAILTLGRYEPVPSWDAALTIGRNLIEMHRATWANWIGPEFGLVRETLVYLTGPLVVLLLVQSADAALVARLRAVLLGSLVVAAAVAGHQKLSGAESLALSVLGREGLQRVYGTLGDANTFAAYLVLLLPLLVVETLLLWQQRESRAAGTLQARWRAAGRYGAAAAVLLVLLALVWAASRAAWIGAGVAAVAAAILATRGAVWVKRAAVVALLATCLGGGLFAYARARALPFAEWRSPAHALVALFSPELLAREVRVRWMWWKPALRMGSELPLTGVGVGQYRYFAGAYWNDQHQFGLLGDPHCYYLKPFAELGIPGLAIFLWIGWAVWRTWRAPPHLRLTDAADLRRLAAGVGLLALAVDMVFQHVLVQTEMQVIAAAVVALAVLDHDGRVRG